MSDDSNETAENATSDTETAPNGFDAATAQGPQVGILTQYTKDLSFENPGAPQSLQMEGAPRIEINVNVNARRAGYDVYEV